MAFTFINIMPRVNSYYFSEATNNGLNVLDQADFMHQVQPWQEKAIYLAKGLMTDVVTVMTHTQYNGTTVPYPPKLYVCDMQQNTIAAIDLNVVHNPYYKGLQTVAGNSYIDPFTGAVTALKSQLWSFTWSDFAAYLTPDNYDSIYYLRLDNFDDAGNIFSYYSEPVLLRSSLKDVFGWERGHANTLLLQASYNASRSQNTNIIMGGWSTDNGTTLTPFTPIFNIRCEGYVLQVDQKAVNIGYLQQNYEQVFITGQQMPMKMLKLGDLSTGIPDYMLQQVTEVLLSDLFFVNGYNYKVYNQGSQTTPADMWKSKRDDNTPLLYANTVITVGSIAQQAMVTPAPGLPPFRYHDFTADPTGD